MANPPAASEWADIGNPDIYFGSRNKDIIRLMWHLLENVVIDDTKFHFHNIVMDDGETINSYIIDPYGNFFDSDGIDKNAINAIQLSVSVCSGSFTFEYSDMETLDELMCFDGDAEDINTSVRLLENTFLILKKYYPELFEPLIEESCEPGLSPKAIYDSVKLRLWQSYATHADTYKTSMINSLMCDIKESVEKIIDLNRGLGSCIKSITTFEKCYESGKLTKEESDDLIDKMKKVQKGIISKIKMFEDEVRKFKAEIVNCDNWSIIEAFQLSID